MAGKWHLVRRTAVAVTAGLVLATATGCAGGDKAGGQGGTLTLRLGTEDTAGRPSGVAITEFARQVKAISGGRIKIEPVFNAGGKPAPGWDQRVAEKVMAGELDMGLTPARAWDLEGVRSLRALHAPFLVDSAHLMDAVATSDLAKGMLAGLDRAGVVGLALLPEDLRHPFGFKRPLLTLEDFHGSGVRAPLSEVSYATLRSLGAEPRDLVGHEFTKAVRDGTVAGMESGFSLASSTAPEPTVAAANVSLYPKVNTLVVDDEAWGRLNRAQRQVLRTAARRTLTHVLDSSVPEAEAAQRFCARGGRVVLARPEDLAAMARSVQPVYAELERDPQTREQIGRIRELKEQPSPAEAAPAACSPPAAEPAAAGRLPAGKTSGRAFPEGVYRADIPPEFLVAHGIDSSMAANNSGLFTVTFRDGRWKQHDTTQDGPDCTGRYAVRDRRVVVMPDDREACGSAAGIVLYDAHWTLHDGRLRFTDVRSGEGQDLFARVLWGGKPWRKIG